jgi:cytochrome c-type biogenesis protein CcmH/NrfG
MPHSSLSADESLDLLRRAVVLSEDPFVLRDYANKAWETGRFEQAVAAFTQLKEAVGPNRDFFSRVAEASMEAIQRGERPATSVCWYPGIT